MAETPISPEEKAHNASVDKMNAARLKHKAKRVKQGHTLPPEKPMFNVPAKIKRPTLTGS